MKHPEWERPYKLRAPWFFGIVGVLFCIYVIYVALSAMNRNAWIVLLIYLAIGVVLWGYAKIMQKKNPDEWQMVITSPDTVKETK